MRGLRSRFLRQARFQEVGIGDMIRKRLRHCSSYSLSTSILCFIVPLNVLGFLVQWNGLPDYKLDLDYINVY
jgi:hypothetical protein